MTATRWAPRLVALLLLLCVPGAVSAQAHEGAEEHDEAATEDHGGTEHHGEGGHGGFHKNTIALFLGTTQAEREDGERDDPEFTLGLDYERRLSEVFGLGAILDVVLEGHREGLLMAAGFFHWGEAKFVLAPGVERIRDSGHTEPVIRLGAMYAFPAGSVHLEPSLFYDVTEEGGTWVLGLTIGHGW